MDITPAAYAHWRESELGSITEHLEQEAIFSQVPDLREWNVLDAGCGDGTYAIEASQHGAIVTGLDCSWPMLVAARQREQQSLSKAGILWCHGQVEALPFQDASFDLVLAITVLCLVPPPNRVIGELARVLRPGCHFCSCSAASISNCTLDEGHRWFYGFLSPTQLVTEYLRHA